MRPATRTGTGTRAAPAVPQFRKLGYQVVDWVVDYYKGLPKRRRVRPNVQVCGPLPHTSPAPPHAPATPYR